ncbi:MAG: hypothetical protein ACE5IL_11030 [Myxococcota bacterium]
MVRAKGPALGLIALLVLGAAAAALAHGRGVSLRVMVVSTDPEGEGDDPGCGGLRRQLGPMRVGRMHMLEQRNFVLRFGEVGAVTLPAGGVVRLIPIGIHAQRLHMQLQMPGQVDTRVQMPAGRAVIVGGARYGRGHLIVRIIPYFQPESP